MLIEPTWRAELLSHSGLGEHCKPFVQDEHFWLDEPGRQLRRR
jgi:hypothetical protein